MDVTITEDELDLLAAAERGVPRHVNPDHDEKFRALERRHLVRRTAESWWTTDDGGRALVAAGRKNVHLAVQRWGRAAKGGPS